MNRRASRRRLVSVRPNGVLNGGRGAVMQQRTPKPQAPQGGRPELLRLGGFLTDTVAGPHVVQQQIREQRHHLVMEQRVRVGSGLKRRHMAGPAANGAKQHLARAHGVVDRPPSGWREKFHERFEVVDPAPPRSPIRAVFRIGNPVAQRHLLRVMPNASSVGNRSFVIPISFR